MQNHRHKLLPTWSEGRSHHLVLDVKKVTLIWRLPAPTLENLVSRWLRSTVAPSFSHVMYGAGLPLAAQSSVASAPASDLVLTGDVKNAGAIGLSEASARKDERL